MPIQPNADFKLTPIPPIAPAAHTLAHLALGLSPSPLGPLAALPGTWKGTGFNQIWRPFFGSQDRFLELNLTAETLEFTEIPGEIPNRGLLQQDIVLFGMTYLQQVQDSNVKGADGTPAGIHIEPGIWINLPATTNPAEQATVARLANIPHGTSLLAQGSAFVVNGPPVFAAASITPFVINQPGNLIQFPESNLAVASAFRSPPADIVGVTQAMVDNPNVVLAAALAGKTITSTTVLQISTAIQAPPVPDSGGGTANIAFLTGSGNPPNPNAISAEMDAIFWIETFTDASGATGTMLQYSQRVLLNFNGLSWPHISVATLVKQQVKPPKFEIKEVKEKVEIKEHKPEIKEHKSEIKEHKPEIKEHKVELKEHLKPEIKEIEISNQFPPPIPDPMSLLQGRVAALEEAAKATGRPFIKPDERPSVGDATLGKNDDKKSS